jgi:hypothetical protein
MENFKFARVCSATGRGINEGYCCLDGDAYFIYDADLLWWLRSNVVDAGYESMSDESVMADAYESGIYYYTEWYELDEEGWYESPYGDGRDAVYVEAQ